MMLKMAKNKERERGGGVGILTHNITIIQKKERITSIWQGNLYIDMAYTNTKRRNFA